MGAAHRDGDDPGGKAGDGLGLSSGGCCPGPQQSTPPATMKHACPLPAAAVPPCRPSTATGRLENSSAPLGLCPQHAPVPPYRAHVKYAPTATALTVGGRLTATGRELSSMLPLPSEPASFSPQQLRAPPTMAQVVASPATTVATGLPSPWTMTPHVDVKSQVDAVCVPSPS